jgi:diguanylate cyclase (GGDEF)-like protein
MVDKGMTYNLSNIISDKQTLLEEFIDTYTACINLPESTKLSPVIEYYQKIFQLFAKESKLSEILTAFEELASYKISTEVPYTIISNEIYSLENLLMMHMPHDTDNTKLLELIKLFKAINDRIAYQYLLEYIDKLIFQNKIRQASLNELVEKNLIIHYESHLIWLTELAIHIKEKKRENFPELNDIVCPFGKWLHTEAKESIKNDARFKIIDTIHKNLHTFAKKIYNILETQEYHILITYLEKCEMISLSIGTELALLDHMLINKKISKDSLTGALNRNALHTLFENEYELALATNTSFILAICDLDHFKKVNDTYGHVAGDHVLAHFVAIVKENLRASDVIIRYGGEEFVIMLPAINKENGYKVLNKIRHNFASKPVAFKKHNIYTTVSIGMIEVQPHHMYKKTFVDEYIMMADQNLYMAKENGRNRIEFY